MTIRLLLGVGLLGPLFGSMACTTKDSPEDRPPPKPSVELQRSTEAALLDPGKERGWGASSLPEVTKWALHDNAGITVLGKNAKGLIEVGVTVQYDRPNQISVLGCATAGKVSCEEAVRAITRDLAPEGVAMGGTGAVAPRWWPFGESEEAKSDRCANGLVQLIEATPAILGNVTAFKCQEGDALELKLQARGWDEGANPCFAMTGGYIGEGAPDLADACCNGEKGRSRIVGNDDRGLLVDTGIDLICR